MKRSAAQRSVRKRREWSGALKTFIRPIGKDEMPFPAGDQKITERHPERQTVLSCKITGYAEIIQTSKYSGAHLRQIRAERGVGRPPLARAANLG